MTQKIIGTCSICGGDVPERDGIGFLKCNKCGAVESTGLPVLSMRRSTSDIAAEILADLDAADATAAAVAHHAITGE